MNNWLLIAFVAYLAGAVIEGVNTANQLFRSAPELAKDEGEPGADSQLSQWHVFTAIATVTICGAFSWPCRLIHRSLKELHDQQQKQQEE
ncbi:hypothetical protein IQ268_21640 [Oculatella sp. LEGE 06141]|uniref:hypothetical protein n=1 Tax=Oculatella sp. LEGE 06141 TaxID=1828648 RepID=UPI001881B476|nr:hypothetical protein [Oculatella sp. LEGE 06141]MBE9181168.1 hypothetical protein [Oculatella sp. LEGE 06141]